MSIKRSTILPLRKQSRSYYDSISPCGFLRKRILSCHGVSRSLRGRSKRDGGIGYRVVVLMSRGRISLGGILILKVAVLLYLPENCLSELGDRRAWQSVYLAGPAVMASERRKARREFPCSLQTAEGKGRARRKHSVICVCF